jgi:hypothetical protein
MPEVGGPQSKVATVADRGDEVLLPASGSANL